MAVLERFSEKEANYHLYQARQNAIREEKTRQKLLEEALRGKEEALRGKEEALRGKEEALRREANRSQIIRIAEGINHATPTTKELSKALKNTTI